MLGKTKGGPRWWQESRPHDPTPVLRKPSSECHSNLQRLGQAGCLVRGTSCQGGYRQATAAPQDYPSPLPPFGFPARNPHWLDPKGSRGDWDSFDSVHTNPPSWTESRGIWGGGEIWKEKQSIWQPVGWTINSVKPRESMLQLEGERELQGRRGHQDKCHRKMAFFSLSIITAGWR